MYEENNTQNCNWKMESDYREAYGIHLHSTQFLPSARIDSSLQPRRSGHELGRMHHQRLGGDRFELSSHPRSHPHPHPHPLSSTQAHDFREAVLREIEKESIREEIITSEIIRRRALEAEVRYEMMMERAMALQRRRNGFPSESPRLMGSDVPARFPLAETRAEGRFLEERIMFLPPSRNTLNNWHEGGGSDAIPFQRAPIDERITRLSEVEPVLEASSEEKKMILQAKPIMNITGAKRARAGSGSIGSQSDGNVKKKAKVEWSCALCQVSVDDERTLNMHLAGKRHKREEAALNAQKAGKNTSRMPLGTDKAVDSMKGSGIAHPAINSEVKLTSESLPHGNNGGASSATGGPLPLDKKSNSDNSKKKKKMRTNNEPEKTPESFWCEICQIRMARNQKMMDAHLQGKKHKRRVKLGDGTRAVGPSNENVKTEERDGKDTKKAEEEIRT